MALASNNVSSINQTNTIDYMSEDVFKKIWDNPLDADYDKL
jgi:hypothetical protein